jgi:hypothetical protein
MNEYDPLSSEAMWEKHKDVVLANQKKKKKKKKQSSVAVRTGGNHRNTGTPEHEEIPHIGPEHEESHARHIKTKRTLSSTLIITLDRKRTWTDSSHGVPIGPFIFFQCG